MRATYFSVASFWGFIVGVLGVLTALQVEAGESFKPDAGIFIYLVPAVVIAIVGGLVISRAYRDAKRK
jgi:type III secretory pathway component EscS